MEERINVIFKRPGMEPVLLKDVKNELKTFQKLVDGYIEVYALAPNCAIVCNEEGWIRDLHYNCTTEGQQWFGNILWVGIDGEEFCSCPISFENFKRIYKDLFKGEEHEQTK